MRKLLIALCLLLMPVGTSAGTVTVPYSFTPNTTIYSGQVNADFAALIAGFSNVDNSNIGTLGIYASQIKPITVANATFGSGQVYTFPGMTGGPSVIIDMSGALGNGGLELIDTTNTAVTPAKYIRADGLTGSLEIVNSAGNAIIGALSDIGAWAVAGSISAFGHPIAFDPRFGLQPNYHFEGGAIQGVGGASNYNVAFTTNFTIPPETCYATLSSYAGNIPTSNPSAIIIGYLGTAGAYNGMTIRNMSNNTMNINYGCWGY